MCECSPRGVWEKVRLNDLTLTIERALFASQIIRKDAAEDFDYHDLMGQGHPYDWKQGDPGVLLALKS